MAKPAARVGDPHECRMSDGPKPHVGGTILAHFCPPDKHPVYIGQSALAATQGDPCPCVSSLPNEIKEGSGTVFINGRQAARASDPTTHKGKIQFGSEDVLIGDFAALAAAKVFPGGQIYGNCGVRCCEQIIHQFWGYKYDEKVILDYAVDTGLAYSGRDSNGRYHRHKHGSMYSDKMQKLLEKWHVGSDELRIDSAITTKHLLENALKKNKGIIASVNSNLLHYDSSPNDVDHVVLVTEGDFNRDGKLTHVCINDTGDAFLPDQGLRLPLIKLLIAMRDRRAGGSSYELVITHSPIWHQFTPDPSTTHPPFPPIPSIIP